MQRELQSKQHELEKAKNRITEIDKLIQRLYEDNVSGKLNDERFNKLSDTYEDEQKALRENVTELEHYLSTEIDKTVSVQKFVQKVKKIMEPKELTSELVHEFIDKIVVHEARYLDNKRYQIVDIYYRGVGIFKEFTPEEMEEGLQESLREQRERKEKLKKTA